MDDEKEMIRKIRNSIRNKRSNAEIMQALQDKGCNLAYSEALISKARRPKKILVFSIISLFILGILAVTALAIIAPIPNIRSGSFALKNPLEGFRVLFEEKPVNYTKPVPTPKNSITNQSNNSEDLQEIYLEDVEITPEFISYLLTGIGADEILHKHTITREVPMINFKIEDINYQTVLDDSIEVSTGLNDEADIQFNTDKETLVNATLSDEPSEVFKDSVIDGTTQIETLAGETELFAKGYLELYNEFK